MKRYLVLAACAHPAPPPVQPLADEAALAIANVQQVVELGDATYAFAPHQIAIVRGNAIVANVTAPVAAWSAATTIPALDGEGRWVVASDDHGAIYRVRATGELESIASELGVSRGRVVGAATSFAIAGDDIALSTDGVHLSRYKVSGELAIAPGKLAVADPMGVEVWDLAKHQRIRWPIAHATPAFLGDKLVLVTLEAVYVDGDRLPASHPMVAIAGSKLWVASGGTLYTFDGAALVRTTAALPAGVRIFAGHDGGVWIADAHGISAHTQSTRVDDPQWRASIEPVFQRVCAHCHLPGGSADLDLSTLKAWQDERPELIRRVLVTRTMPPAGTDLADADRAALAAWLNARR